MNTSKTIYFLIGFVLSVFFLLPNISQAAIVQVQTKGASMTTDGTSLLVTTNSSGGGNLLVVCLGYSSTASASTTITDNKLNTYTLVKTITSGTNAFSLNMYYAKNVIAGVTSMTANFPFTSYADLVVTEYSGADINAPLDKFQANDMPFNGGTSWTSGITATTSQANEIVAGCAFEGYRDVPLVTFTPGSGLTPRIAQGGSYYVDKNVSSIGAYEVNGTNTTNLGYEIVANVATFMASNPLLPAAPTISSFTASPASVTQGQSATLSWVVTGNPTPTLSINNGIGIVTGSSVVVSPVVSTTYTLTAVNASGTVTASTTVTVASPDTTPPTVPTGLTATAISPSQVNLSWTASTDNVGVVGYRVFRNSVQVASITTGTTYSDTGLSPSTTYSYTVAAYDAAGNVSGQSTPASVTTPAPIAPVSSPPTIFFTDIESGPKTGGEGGNGVFVTIYGKNFGPSPSVTVGGGQAIVKLTTSPWMWYQKMTIQLGPNANTGDVVMTTTAGSSNTLPFTVRPGNIFCVSTTGSDTNPGTFAGGCWKTMQHAIDTVLAGDTVYARAGVTEAQASSDGSVKLGWRGVQNNGIAGSPIAIGGYPGEVATIGATGSSLCSPASTTCFEGLHALSGVGLNYSYWTFFNLTMRGQQYAFLFESFGTASTTLPSTNIRVIGNDFSCPWMNGASGPYCVTFAQNNYNYVYGNNVHDVQTYLYALAPGPEWNGGLYFTTDTNRVWVGWNTVANINGARGIQFHSSPLGLGDASDPTGRNQYDLHVHDNLVHDIAMDGILFATVDPSKGPVEAYNNIVYNAGKGPQPLSGGGGFGGIFVPGYTNTGPAGIGTVEVYNNTLYNNAGETLTIGPDWGAAIYNNAPANGSPNLKMRIRNNIVHQANSAPYLLIWSAVGKCTTTCDNIYGTNNLFFGSGAPVSNPNVTANLNADPKFANLVGLDFHLQLTSPAIDAGITITGLIRDLDAISRPQGPAFDLGAYEFYIGTPPSLDTTPPTVPTGLTATAISPSQVNLSWTASTDNVGVVGYRVFRNSVQVASITTGTTYSDTGLSPSTTYSYTVAAYDAAGNVSGQSTPVSATTQAPVTTPPVISAISTSSITSTGAAIAWTTDQSSDSQVEYGLTSAYGSTTTLGTTLVTAHSQSLTGLTVSTLYHYRVKSKNASGLLATSGDNTFTTSANPPVISLIQSTNITDTTATITWVTDKPSTSKVNYGLTLSYTLSTVKDSALVTSHSVTIGSITASTLYHYQVESTDAINLTSVSTDRTFTTTAAPILPVISNILAANITSTGASISWATDKSSDSQVEYGLTAAYGSSTAPNPTLVTGHSQSLTGLSSGTTYHYRVKSSGSVSIDQTFTTFIPIPPDTTPPAAINNLATGNITPTSITLSWTAPGNDGNIGTAASYQIRYSILPITESNWSIATALSGSPLPLPAGTTQAYTALGLTTNTTYYFAIKTLDAAGNISALSNVPSTKTKRNPPGPVTGLTATVGSINLAWSAPANAGPDVKYILFKSNNTGLTNYNQITTETKLQDSSILLYNDSAITNDVTYYYTVFAYYDIGYYSPGTYISAISAKKSASRIITGGGGGGDYLPAIPQKIKFNRVIEADQQIILEWANPSDPNFSRLIIIEKENTPPTSITDGYKAFEGNMPSFTITNLINGKTYYFALYSLGLAGNYSEPVIIKASPQAGVAQFKEKEVKGIAQTIKYVPPTATQSAVVFLPGTLIKSNDSPKVFIVQNNQKRWIKTYGILKSYKFKDKNIKIQPKEIVDQYPNGPDLDKPGENLFTPAPVMVPAYPDGTLIKGSGPTIYYIENGQKRAFGSRVIFDLLGYRLANIKRAKNSQLNLMSTGQVITLTSTHPNGTLVKLKNKPEIYLIENNLLRWISSIEIFRSRGYSLDKVIIISLKELKLYEVGEKI